MEAAADGDAAGVSVNERFLLDEDIELDGIEEQESGSMKLVGARRSWPGAGLINIPGVDFVGASISAHRPC